MMDDTESGRTVLPINTVASISGKEIATQMAREEEVFSRSKRLNFDFGKDSAGKEVALKLFYFTGGLRWIPTYRVSGELKDKADLSLQGEVLNELEDVENAAWHYLCNARATNPKKARGELIPVTRDARVPMKQVLELFAGRLKPQDVLDAAEKADLKDEPLKEARFYAHLYVALYYESEGDAKKAL